MKLVAQGANKAVERKFGLMQELEVEATYIDDATNFYIRQINKQAKEIDQHMGVFDPSKSSELEKPIRKGTLCAGLFAEDK